MEEFEMFLFAMQAAGAITSIWQNQGAESTIQQGRKLEKAGIEANMAALNYEFEESSLADMQTLRQNLGTQIVMDAARGNASGTQGSVVRAQKSISASSKDTEAKRMRLLAKEADLRAKDVLSGLHTLESETELGRSTSKVGFDLASSGLRSMEYSDLVSRFLGNTKGAK
jgi:IMP dehydrogenase/GMP reductase